MTFGPQTEQALERLAAGQAAFNDRLSSTPRGLGSVDQDLNSAVNTLEALALAEHWIGDAALPVFRASETITQLHEDTVALVNLGRALDVAAANYGMGSSRAQAAYNFRELTDDTEEAARAAFSMLTTVFKSAATEYSARADADHAVAGDMTLEQADEFFEHYVAAAQTRAARAAEASERILGASADLTVVMVAVRDIVRQLANLL